jgi:phosphoribosylformylglycinamidine synthase
MLAPVSLIVSAFAPVRDVNRSLTPQMDLSRGDSRLLLIDLGNGRNRLGGSALAQVNGVFGQDVPDLDSPAQLKAFFTAIQDLNASGFLLGYHDRSDGGLITTLCEMAFASHCGLELTTEKTADDLLPLLFAEEPGAVIQVKSADLEKVRDVLVAHGLAGAVSDLGAPVTDQRLSLSAGGTPVLDESLPDLQHLWSETSHAVQSLRDNPDCADQESAWVNDWQRAGLAPALTFDPEENPAAPMIATSVRPPVAILREQGVNGHLEMAAAFDLAGFDATDVHMSDLLEGRRSLREFAGFVACGGFSYGDVLGAGRGWAKSILFSDEMREQFGRFLEDREKFALGVCNGCQMLAALRELIPGTASWPDFIGNRSEQFEARLGMVRVDDSPSIFFRGMAGSFIPVATAHGEGRAEFGTSEIVQDLVVMRYIDSRGRAAEHYPDNPNGSPQGITGLCNSDGRISILMPHPERSLRTVNFSWAPRDWSETSPWQRMFRNARQWTG